MNPDTKQKGWKELPMGALLPCCTAEGYNTGNWRTFKPVWNPEKCIHCLQCWLSCPDFSALVKDEKMTGFDYEHCKGCGLCAWICPAKGKAIVMEKESKE